MSASSHTSVSISIITLCNHMSEMKFPAFWAIFYLAIRHSDLWPYLQWRNRNYVWICCHHIATVYILFCSSLICDYKNLHIIIHVMYYSNKIHVKGKICYFYIHFADYHKFESIHTSWEKTWWKLLFT